MSTLTHTPAHTTEHPDRFVDDETGLGYEVFQDTDAEDPRGWISDEHAAIWAYREPQMRHSVAADRPDNRIIDAFAEFYERTDDDDLALELTKRWARVFHPEDTYDIEARTINGYSQSDWLDVIAVVEDGYGTAASHIDEFRMWAFGDVWTVVSDSGDALSGIYANSAEEAVEYYRDHHEPDTTTVSRTLELTITAGTDEELDAKHHWIVSAFADSDALPEGVSITEPSEDSFA